MHRRRPREPRRHGERRSTAVGLCAAADRDERLDDTADGFARRAIRQVVDRLPELSHKSYLALRRCDLLDPERSRGNKDFELPAFAAVWLALVRLVREPTPEMFEMRARYKG